MLGEYPLFDSFCAAVFMLGTFVFILGLINNLYVWTKGTGRGIGQVIKEALGIIFSKKVGLFLSAVLDSFIHRRLFKENILRGIAMLSIIISYIGIIVVNHIKAAGMPELHNISHLTIFLYSPFSDFYFLRSVTEATFNSTQALYALLNDGFGFLILVVGEGILIWRRFIKRAYVFRMKWADVFGVAILGGWFVLRFMAEAVSILTFNIPDSIAWHWFVGYGISKIIAPLGLHWPDFYLMSWSLSGIFLATLVGSIPFNRKLWHIFTAPIAMVLNSISEERHIFSKAEDEIPFSKRQLIEIDGCVKCGICADHCVVYKHTRDEHSVSGGVISSYGLRLRQRYGFFSSLIDHEPPTKDVQELFATQIYTCTLCGRCKEVCPIKINTRSLRVSMREGAVREKIAPNAVNMALDAAKKVHNVLNYPNADRLMWAEFIDDVPQEAYLNKKRAEVIYFVGCMTSFSPAISSIAEANLRLLYQAEEDFALLGENEWCCGFPLIVAGLSQEWQALRDKNVETIKRMQAKQVVFNCASCYHTFKHEYQEHLLGVEFLHNTEYIQALVADKKIGFKGIKARVAYHDPCDLGRGCGVFEPPRKAIKSIPGIEYVELPLNRRFSTCCGGGGDLEMVNADLVNKIAGSLVEEFNGLGVDIVATACGQCKRMIQNAIKVKGSRVKVMDVAELVLAAGMERIKN
ncbi:(Fe-S)-binding protein [bacterium]|nr:(Fe-S)-binding protein [bacterium]